MGTIADKFGEAFRDYETDGVPASGAHKPVKHEVQALGAAIEQAVGSAALGSVSVVKSTLSALNSDLAHPDSTTALVYADAAGTNNDIYVKSGASGTGSWTNTGILHLVSGAAAASAASAATSATAAAAARDAVRPLFGTVAPTTEGVDGQSYYRISGGIVTFYGPKVGGVWPAGVVLNGAQGIPGNPGTAATVAVSTTSTLAPGSAATVTNVGTSTAGQFAFGIPQGLPGLDGAGTQTINGLVQSPASTAPILLAFADTSNRTALTVYADGTCGIVLDSASNAKTLAAGGLSASSGLNQLGAENAGGSYANGLAFMQATVDLNGRIVGGYLLDGTTFIGKYDSRLFSAVTASEGPALSRTGPLFSTSGGQIIAYYGNGTKVLTSEGTNSEPRPLGDRVAFLSNRQRSLTAPYIMNFDGTNQRALIDQAMYEGYAMAGQSQTPGYISTPSLTVAPPYPGKAFSYAGGAGPIAEYPATFGGSGTLTDLMEDPTAPFKGESAASSIGAAILDHELTYRPKLKVVLYGNGYPATAYTGIMKGTGPYNDVIAQTTRLKALGDIEVAATRAPAGVTRGAITRALILIHGETDYNNASYAANLAQLQSDYETDIRAATLQVEPVPMIMTQLGSLRMWATAPDAAGANKSCLAQLAVSVSNPKIFLACPTYQLSYVGDNIHYVNTSKRLIGEYFEKAVRKVVHEGRDWVPLSPKPFAQWTIGTNTISIPFYVPIGPMAFDTTLVSDPGNKGFSYTDAAGRTITNVQITGANSDTILITLSGAIGSTALLDYAYSNGTNSTSGPTTGARGCLRDSDPALSRWDGTTHLYNWAVIFRQAIN